MKCYTLLLFDGDDKVSAVRTIAAANARAAEEIASVTRLAHQRCAGYQLWGDGECIAQTYPGDLHRAAIHNRALHYYAG